MKIDPYYTQQKCRPKIGVSSNIRFMQIFLGDCWTAAVKWQWDCRKWRFSLNMSLYLEQCILETKLLQDGNRKPYASYRMVSRSMTMKIKWVLWRFRCSPNDRKLLALSLFRHTTKSRLSETWTCDGRHDNWYTSHFVLKRCTGIVSFADFLVFCLNGILMYCDV